MRQRTDGSLNDLVDTEHLLQENGPEEIDLPKKTFKRTQRKKQVIPRGAQTVPVEDGNR